MEEDFELDDTYIVSDGKLGGIDIPISGMKPISGTLTYEDNELKSGCLTFDDHKVTYDGSKFTNEKGTCPTGRAITYIDNNGVKYYNTEWIGANPIYYNPVTGEKCDNYHEDNSKTGYNGVSGADNQTSCLKWYAYSEQNGNVNLLLDHNTTAPIPWVTEDDYGSGVPELAMTLRITYPNNKIVGEDSYGEKGNWNKGPITLLKQLKTDTEGWSAVPNRIDNYTNINNKYGENTTNYTINYIGYKARLITSQEIAYVTGNTSWYEKLTSSEYFYFDSKTKTGSPTCKKGDTLGCSYGWLYDRTSDDCTIWGCSNNSDAVSQGYWIVSSYANNYSVAWRVQSIGRISGCDIGHIENGLRPVITVSKSTIFES